MKKSNIQFRLTFVLMVLVMLAPINAVLSQPEPVPFHTEQYYLNSGLYEGRENFITKKL